MAPLSLHRFTVCALRADHRPFARQTGLKPARLTACMPLDAVVCSGHAACGGGAVELHFIVAGGEAEACLAQGLEAQYGFTW